MTASYGLVLVISAIALVVSAVVALRNTPETIRAMAREAFDVVHSMRTQMETFRTEVTTMMAV